MKTKVYYSTCWASDKNIGGAMNDFCSLVPDDAFICLRDGDSIFLTHDWGKRIEDIIEANTEFDLIGCTTNRLRSDIQLYGNKFSDETDILKHIEIANSLQGTEIQKTSEIAGLFMLFPKSLWQKVKFRENCVNFDRLFCKDVLKIGGKIGFATGLYLFHCYRMGKQDPKNYVDHLLK